MKYTYTIPFLLSLIIISCSFPRKSILKKVQGITKEMNLLQPMVLKEFTNNVTFKSTIDIKNPALKNNLKKYNFSALTVNYRTKENATAQFENPILIDSSIIFHINKSSTDENILINIVYCFAQKKPAGFTVPPGIEMKQINDSVWVTRSISHIVLVY